MPKSKKKNSQERRDPVAENQSKVIKAGIYDGSQSSKDFVVSGHSTGSQHSEMEALSHQVSIDAGAVPAYETDDNYLVHKTSTDFGEALPEDRRDTADLGGPDLYGPHPDLIEDHPIKLNRPAGRRWGLWGSLGLVGAGALGLAAYGLYKSANANKQPQLAGQ